MPSRRRRVCPGFAHGSPPAFPVFDINPLRGLGVRLLCGAVVFLPERFPISLTLFLSGSSDRWCCASPDRMHGTDPATALRPPVFFLSRLCASL